jgi:hypothetical protein
MIILKDENGSDNYLIRRSKDGDELWDFIPDEVSPEGTHMHPYRIGGGLEVWDKNALLKYPLLDRSGIVTYIHALEYLYNKKPSFQDGPVRDPVYNIKWHKNMANVSIYNCSFNPKKEMYEICFSFDRKAMINNNLTQSELIDVQDFNKPDPRIYGRGGTPYTIVSPENLKRYIEDLKQEINYSEKDKNNWYEFWK